MKIPLNWLRQYVDISHSVKSLAERLTLAGVNVAAVEIKGQGWDRMVVGRVTDVRPHPNADRLSLVTVDTGPGQVQIVSGAPNLEAGQKVPYAPSGAELIDGHTGELVRLKPAKIRGIVSEGMVCSEKELGISDRHEGIMVLPADAPVGMPLADYLGDVVLELEVTPNRPDWLSILGIGREVSALTGAPLRIPPFSYAEDGKPIPELASVEIADPDLCPRYCASLVQGVTLAPSPLWMQERLLSCGMRPINNVVDTTNYVMLELGQPLHAFDFRLISGSKIVVRRAREGETITTLDGVQRLLKPETLVIADQHRAVAIAGVMGGTGSEVSQETSTVLLESANFQRASIRLTSQQLLLRTEASLRFEKGLNAELALYALQRATQLVLEIAGGNAPKGIIDVYPGRKEPAPITLSVLKVKRLLGIEINGNRVKEVLQSLGFDVAEASAGTEFLVKTPYWRSDVHIAADLVEEIGRILGYDNIPLAGLKGPLPQWQEDTMRTIKEKAKSTMVGCGFQEVITYSFTSLEKLKKTSSDTVLPGPAPLRLFNPLSEEQAYLRTSLRPGLLATIGYNQRYREDYIRLFEIGRVYLPRDGQLPQEKEVLEAALSGLRHEPFWQGEKKGADFFDAKGVAMTLLSHLGIRRVEFQPGADASFLPGMTARVLVEGKDVGIVGELHPAVARAFDISAKTFLVEIDLESLIALGLSEPTYQPLPRYPGAFRDLAVVADRGIPGERIARLVSSTPLVDRVTLFDVYEGKQLPPDKRSLAFRVVFQSPSHTLTETEVNEAQKGIVGRLHQELGATLRA